MKLYDYIRSLKLLFIRFVKNISLFVSATCVVITVVILVAGFPKSSTSSKTPASSNSYDQKVQAEKEKKNSIMRRFISYHEVKHLPY